MNPVDGIRFISNSSIVCKTRLNVSAVCTGPDVPLVIVGSYYLPSNETKINRPRTLKERAYGTKDNNSGYPIGAQLLSNPSEYTIPSDRISYQKNDYGFKYFREIYGQPHRDARFGSVHNSISSNAERAIILRNLLAAWSSFTDEKQIPYWIAHGSLLGWWWGGSFLPWDSDIDVQMNANFLYVLERFNNTVLSNRYLIDVNPHFRARYPQKHNVIDARLVDQHTGYFLDITGLANVGTETLSDPKNIVLCDKHVHKLLYSELYPLVRIDFHGIGTWRPYNVERCLIKEYGSRALLKTAYRGYNYDMDKAIWIGNGPLLEYSSPLFGGRMSAARFKPIQVASGRSQHRLTRINPKH